MDIIAGKMFFSPSRSTSADITEGLPTPRVCREKIFAFLFFAKEKLKVKKVYVTPTSPGMTKWQKLTTLCEGVIRLQLEITHDGVHSIWFGL